MNDITTIKAKVLNEMKSKATERIEERIRTRMRTEVWDKFVQMGYQYSALNADELVILIDYCSSKVFSSDWEKGDDGFKARRDKALDALEKLISPKSENKQTLDNRGEM